MRRCSSCSAEVPDTGRTCGTCGAAVGLAYDSRAATLALDDEAAPSSSPKTHFAAAAVAEGRFPPGTMVAQRYRISGLLGRGGMGEVYKATDLLLGQAVALKVLPEAVAASPAMLERFRNEVRIARQVSHPNVCRVYDMGEAEGLVFLTMEYVDGEDLQSLLRRIGSLPVPKALDIARRLCHGLAAAHAKSVLHRDLKPGNIMLDGRGQVLITDFGLAVLAGEMDPADARHGTPAYMAPEQLTGLEVTTRSDIYALGLVLYEIFAGRRPYEAQSWDQMIRMEEQATPPALATLVKDIDPAIERAILHCLAPRPADRPATALAVASALPGSDPLAIALAAGETPSPEAVASAGQTRGVRTPVAAACFACLVAGLIAMAWITGRVSVLARAATDLPPVVLAQKARETLAGFGYGGTAPGVAWNLSYNRPFLENLEGQTAAAARVRLARGRPPAVYLWYRRSPRPVEPQTAQVLATDSDPPPTFPGMVSVRLDLEGRLLALAAVPPPLESAGEAPAFDWNRLFQAAGLDVSHFRPAPPKWTPPAAFDARAAWLEQNAPAGPLRVEAAAWHGHPVYFRVDPEGQAEPGEAVEEMLGMSSAVLLPLALLTVLGGAALAWRNLRTGRGDQRGAVRVGTFVAAANLLAWVWTAPHYLTTGEATRFILALALASCFGWCTATQYLALEPMVRRHWPRALISWSRLLAGSVRDPLVGWHILIGLLGGVLLGLLFRFHGLLYGPAAADTRAASLDLAWRVRGLPGGLCYAACEGLLRACTFFLLLFLLSRLLRNRALGALAFAVLCGFAFAAASSRPLLSGVFFGAAFALVAWATLRHGLLALAALMWSAVLLARFPMTLDTSAWYFGSGMFAVSCLAAAGFCAFRTAAAAPGGPPKPEYRLPVSL